MFDDFHGFRIDTLLRLANAEPALSDALRSALVLPTTAAETAGPDLPGVFENDVTARRAGLAICMLSALASTASIIWLGSALLG